MLRAPFPYFGGKSRAAALVWSRFGKVVNFVEPFFGSGAVLLACPENQRPRVETVNDLSCFLANFWRATKTDPDAVAEAADCPVIETDLHSRHKWLLAQAVDLRAKLDADPSYYDARIAGWWVWGASAWIGSGWCEETAPKDHWQQPPKMAAPSGGNPRPDYGHGVHSASMRGSSRRLPDLAGGTQWGTDEPNARAGRGVHSATARGPSQQLPDLSGARPDGGQVGHGLHAAGMRTRLYDIFAALSARLRHVRVACGDFERILTPSVTYRHGLTAVFLDSPYKGFESVYGQGKPCAPRAREWALEAGQRPDMRIALCGYEGEHDMPSTWECVAWKAKGGYSNAAKGGNNGNAKRERIWFSPACLRPSALVAQADLFAPPAA
jgi:site-specific DNA-adenine methylase